MADKELNLEIGTRVKNMRKYQTKSREKLAEDANISVQFLADIEGGKKSMTTTVLKRLCYALNVTADYIVFGREENNSFDEINEMLRSLEKEQAKNAEEIIKIYIKSVQHK